MNIQRKGKVKREKQKKPSRELCQTAYHPSIIHRPSGRDFLSHARSDIAAFQGSRRESVEKTESRVLQASGQRSTGLLRGVHGARIWPIRSPDVPFASPD